MSRPDPFLLTGMSQEASFKPEFLNRVDEVIIFKPMAKDDILRIVDLQIGLLRKRLADRKIGIAVSRQARELLAERGYDPVYGARRLKRTIQRDIQNPLAMKILAGDYREGDTVAVDVDGKDGFVFGKKQDNPRKDGI
jgi:ATP-dependent Clp protease ATP-binding subunit ClpB